MTTFQTLPRLAWLLVASSLIVVPLAAQRRRPTIAVPQNPVAQKATQPDSAPTFDALLAADSYKIYGEVRGVGQLIRSSGVNDLLDPVMKLAAPPKEFKTIVQWLNTHADAVMTSRLMFAAWPARAKLPKFLCAIEFPSAEEARKFEPQLREFLPRVVPTPMPSPTTSPGPASTKTEPPVSQRKAGSPARQPRWGAETGVPSGAARGMSSSGCRISAGVPYPLGWKNEPTPPPYLIKQSGALVLISNSPFTFRNLRPGGSKLLAEDQNFRLVRDRFTSESIFLYFDVQLEDKTNPRPSPSESPTVVTIAETEKQEDSNDNKEAEPETPAEQVQITPALTESPAATLGGQSSQGQTGVLTGAGHSAAGPSKEPEPVSMLPYLLSGAFFGGTPQWPEAVGAAIAFDADSYVVRTLLVNGPDNKASAIPFIPQLISGPALVPESPAIFPAATELFVAASLDYPQIYEGMTKTIASQNEEMRRRTRQTIKNNEPESPFAFYEKKLGIKIKEDLLPLLGNEIGLAIPMKGLKFGVPQPSPAPEESKENSKENSPQPSGRSLVAAISIKDKEGVQRLIPKIIESLGFEGANLLAQTEKRDDTELVSYANLVSYAFIGNFLVISPDVAATRHVVDSYLNQQSLASNSHFRNFTRWQPQQVLGQIYVSPALMESYNSVASDITSPFGNKMRDFMARIGSSAEPVTYALSNEGMGPFHELHIPKNLLMLMFAGISTEASESPLLANEAVAKSVLRTVASAEATYQATEGNGSFGSLDQLISTGLVSKELMQNYGYKIEVTVSSNKFEVSAVPVEYGKTGKRSYFIDESSILRGGDRGGGPATISDNALQ